MTSPRRSVLAIATIGVLAAIGLTGCRSDGRELMDPTDPLPPTTTTSTTLPPELVPAPSRLP